MLTADPPLSVAQTGHLAGDIPHAVAKSAIDTLLKRGVIQTRLLHGDNVYEPNPQSPYYSVAYRMAVVDLPVMDHLAHLGSVLSGVGIGSWIEPRFNVDPLRLVLVSDIDTIEGEKALTGLGSRLGRSCETIFVPIAQYEITRQYGSYLFDGVPFSLALPHTAAAKDTSGYNRPLRPTISYQLRFSIYLRDNFRCRYCGRGASEVRLALDHSVPWSKGGESTLDNLVTSCVPCNLAKGVQDI